MPTNRRYPRREQSAGGTIGPETTTGAETTTSRGSSKPTLELVGKLAPDLTMFGYLTDGDKDWLYDAGFRNGDFAFLRVTQDETSAAMPVRILYSPRINVIVYKGKDGTEEVVPLFSKYILTEIPHPIPPSGIAKVSPELSDVVQEVLGVYLLMGDFFEPLKRANMQGGYSEVKVDLVYRPPTGTLDIATLLEGVSNACPESMRPYFKGIQLPMQLK